MRPDMTWHMIAPTLSLALEARQHDQARLSHSIVDCPGLLRDTVIPHQLLGAKALLPKNPKKQWVGHSGTGGDVNDHRTHSFNAPAHATEVKSFLPVNWHPIKTYQNNTAPTNGMNHFRFASCGDRTLWFDTTRTLEHINTLALVGYQLTQTKPRNCKLMCNDNAYLPVPQTSSNQCESKSLHWPFWPRGHRCWTVVCPVDSQAPPACKRRWWSGEEYLHNVFILIRCVCVPQSGVPTARPLTKLWSHPVIYNVRVCLSLCVSRGTHLLLSLV